MLGKNPLLVVVIVLSAITALTVIASVSYISELQLTIDNQNQKVSQASSVEKDFKEYQQWATNEITKYQDYSNQLKALVDELESENKFLESTNQRSLEQLINEQDQRYAEDLIESSKPKTTIDDQHINWEVTDSKGDRYSWSMPIETYENLVRFQDPTNILRLDNTQTGETYTVIDYTPFVRNSFSNVIDQIYDSLDDKSQFPYEIWYIVSQLTTYSYDIGDNPRWALETLSRGGGDCEDTVILIADMLKSSKHTKNWKIELVYFDADNPNNPQAMNHVAVHVDDGIYNYILESTSKDDPYAWKDGVVGWYFKV